VAEIYAWADDEYFAKLPGVRAELAKTAKAGAARAEAILDAHRYQGHARITTSHGELDWWVSLDDSRGQSAAAAIEFGRKGGRSGVSSGIHALRSAF
jgi:hypothetical protein